MSWVFLSYALFCNYCFELSLFHMPNAIKLRNWSTWLLLFLFFNSSFCVKMRSDVAFLPLLEISEGECSNYNLASIKHFETWIGAHCRWHSWVRHSLLRLCLPKAAASQAPTPSGTLPVVLTWTSPAKVFALSSPQMTSQADSIWNPFCGFEKLSAQLALSLSLHQEHKRCVAASDSIWVALK